MVDLRLFKTPFVFTDKLKKIDHLKFVWNCENIRNIHVPGQACFTVSWLISWASERVRTGNLTIPGRWYALYTNEATVHHATHVTRVFNAREQSVAIYIYIYSFFKCINFTTKYYIYLVCMIILSVINYGLIKAIYPTGGHSEKCFVFDKIRYE